MPEFRPLLQGIQIAQISCGAQHVAFLTATGQIYTYGGNDVLQCGLGMDAASYVEEPTLVKSLVQSDVTTVICGPSQTAAYTKNNEVYNIVVRVVDGEGACRNIWRVPCAGHY